MSEIEHTYSMVCDQTGEVIPVETYMQEIRAGYWEKAYASILAEYIGVGGTATHSILAWLIKNKDSNNRIIGTFAMIAKDCKTTEPTLNKLFQRLYKKCLLRKLHSGVYMLSPGIMRHGGDAKGVVLFKKWSDK